MRRSTVRSRQQAGQVDPAGDLGSPGIKSIPLGLVTTGRSRLVDERPHTSPATSKISSDTSPASGRLNPMRVDPWNGLGAFWTSESSTTGLPAVVSALVPGSPATEVAVCEP